MKKLVEVKGISEVNAQKLQAAASKLIPMGFTTVSLRIDVNSRLLNTASCAKILYTFRLAVKS